MDHSYSCDWSSSAKHRTRKASCDPPAVTKGVVVTLLVTLGSCIIGPAMLLTHGDAVDTGQQVSTSTLSSTSCATFQKVTMNLYARGRIPILPSWAEGIRSLIIHCTCHQNERTYNVSGHRMFQRRSSCDFECTLPARVFVVAGPPATAKPSFHRLDIAEVVLP
ncbi:hypothetical protein B0H13DRAFT_1908960 [Mycena leptocephala]|nr:hypothetical protein B0H13DRAFT_1908960 [Mycena leptocephala]